MTCIRLHRYCFDVFFNTDTGLVPVNVRIAPRLKLQVIFCSFFSWFPNEHSFKVPTLRPLVLPIECCINIKCCVEYCWKINRQKTRFIRSKICLVLTPFCLNLTQHSNPVFRGGKQAVNILTRDTVFAVDLNLHLGLPTFLWNVLIPNLKSPWYSNYLSQLTKSKCIVVIIHLLLVSVL